KQYDIPRNEEQCRQKLREEFAKYDNIKDIRILDMLVIKVEMKKLKKTEDETAVKTEKELFLLKSNFIQNQLST
ncbi:hypothetical protein NQ318_003343, partial [Aromia moschata]